MSVRSRAVRAAVYLITFGFFLWLFAQVPYTHDDWDWGLDIGLRQLREGSLNARYAGNFFVVVMTRSPLLKTLIMALSCFFLMWATSRLAGKQHPMAVFLLSCVLLLSMRKHIWQQTLGWVSGFANFVISGVFLFFWIRQIFLAFAPEEHESRFGWLFAFPICLAGQLFLENIAIYTVILFFALLVIRKKTGKALSSQLIAGGIGAVVGLAVMFSSGIYQSLFTTGTAINGYRELLFAKNEGYTLLIRLLNQSHLLAGRAMLQNTAYSVSVFLLLLWLTLQRKDRTPKRTLFLAADAVILGLLAYYALAGAPKDPKAPVKLLELAAAGTVFLTALLQLLWLFWQKKNLLGLLTVLWLSVPGVLAPLAVTSEAGNRLFFTSNLLMILVAGLLLEQALENSHILLTRLVSLVLAAALTVLAVHFCTVYSRIGACMRLRQSLIATAVEEDAEAVSLPAYPYAEYLWRPNPNNELRTGYFKDFYGLDPDVNVIFEDGI